MKLLVFLCMFFLGTIASALAGPVQDELESKGIVAGELGSWNEVKDYLGIPYLFLEPEKDGEFRSSIAVTPLGKAEKLVPSRFFEETGSQYAEGRRRYLKKRDGTLIKFQEPKHGRRDSATRVHAFGFEYTLFDQEYHEETHYVFCDSKEMFIVKGLSLRKPASVSSMRSKLERFKCNGGGQ